MFDFEVDQNRVEYFQVIVLAGDLRFEKCDAIEDPVSRFA
jgi:hypothetical protein